MTTYLNRVLIFSPCTTFRWIFEALYKWYFSRKTDGFVYLTAYAYNSFDRSTLFVILTNFLLGMFFLYVLE